jgi:methionyl-tRNA formyltransferase
MRIEAGLDTGPVFAEVRVPIAPRETAGELHARLVDAGTRLLLEHLPGLPSATPESQVGDATYAEKLTVGEFRVDPQRDAATLERVVRAGNPRPGAWMKVGGRRVKVWRAQEADGVVEQGVVDAAGLLGTAAGVLALDEVQPEGKRAMDARAWLAGAHAPLQLET